MSVEGEKGEVDSEEMGEMSLPGIRGSVRSEADGERGATTGGASCLRVSENNRTQSRKTRSL